MNKGWLVVIALPAIAGIAWIAAKDGLNEPVAARAQADRAESNLANKPTPPNEKSVPRPTPGPNSSANSRAKPAETSAVAEPMATKDLQALLEKDPASALIRARKDLAQDPNGSDAAERNWVIVKSLAVLGRYEDARAEAKIMVSKYPESRWAADVERHVLAHP